MAGTTSKMSVAAELWSRIRPSTFVAHSFLAAFASSMLDAADWWSLSPGEAFLAGAITSLILFFLLRFLLCRRNLNAAAKDALRLNIRHHIQNLILPAACVRPVNQATRIANLFRRRSIDISSISIQPAQQPPNCTPLLCFVNSKSGANQGKMVLAQLRMLLNPVQVFDLSKCDPTSVIRAFAEFRGLKVLVAGGDGTVGWILDCIERLPLGKRPPVAIAPLGTGNDLARSLGWGSTVEIDMLPDLLHRISRASVVQMDRWLMVIKPPEDEQSQRSDRRLCFSNYFGVGIDAVICREFHEARQRRPHHFFSQIGNKIWYFLFGGKELLLPQFSGLADAIDLLALQRKVPLPDDTEGLIFTNIPHYGGGVRLWAPTSSSNELESPSQTTMPVTPRASTRRRARSANVDLDSPQSVSAVALAANVIVHTDRVPWRNESLNDGLLECVQISGPLHLGQIQIGLDRATPLAQSAGYDLVLFGSAAVQADGEPLGTFGSGTRVHVQRHSESALMLTIDDSGVATAEAADMARDLIDWAARRDLISSLQSAALLHELHARLV